jgi:hypothetical protein
MSAGWDELMAAGERIEALGFASLFANDHLMPILGDADGPVLGAEGPVFEGWMTLGAWAARTSRVPLGVLVCGVGYRNVGLTVKMATALDHASAGRAILGIGAGWHEPEHRAFGYDALSLGDRISRLDEASLLARGLLDGDAVTLAGRWVRAEAARIRGEPPWLGRSDRESRQARPDRAGQAFDRLVVDGNRQVDDHLLGTGLVPAPQEADHRLLGVGEGRAGCPRPGSGCAAALPRENGRERVDRRGP